MRPLVSAARVLWLTCLISMMIPTPGHAAAPTPVPPGTEAIVFFEQHFQTGESAGDVQLGAQRISADGKLL